MTMSENSQGEKHAQAWIDFLCTTMLIMGISDTCMHLKENIFSKTRRGLLETAGIYSSQLIMKICSKTLGSSALLRSSSSTQRSWWNPQGGDGKKVVLANILTMRLLYLSLGRHIPR